MKGLLSALIDTLVQYSDEMKHHFEEIKPQLLEVLQIKLWPTGHLAFFQVKVEKASLKADIAERC
jgi:hypothetical protein